MRTTMIILLAFVYTMANTANAQAPTVKQQIPSQLISDYSIQAETFDDDGRCWLASPQGLLLFDGSHYFRPIDGLKNINIQNIVFSHLGNKLWVYTQYGFGYVNMNTFRFYYLRRFNLADYNNPITPIKIGNNGSVYTHLPNNCIVGFDTSAHTECTFDYKIQFPDFEVSDFTIWHHQLLLASRVQKAQLLTYNYDNKHAEIHTLASKQLQWINNIDLAGAYLILSNAQSGFHLCDPNKDFALVPHPALDSLNKINQYITYRSYTYKNSILYLFYNNGSLYQYTIDGHRAIKQILNREISLVPHTRINSLYITPQYLLLGAGNGLTILPMPGNIFTNYLTEYLTPVSVRNMIEDENGNIYAGSYQGLFFQKNGQWTNLNHGVREYFFALYCDTVHQYLYVGSEGTPFFRYNIKKQTLEKVFFTKVGFYNPLVHVFAICKEASSEKLLLGYGYGMAEYDPQTKILSSINSVAILFIHPSAKFPGKYWVGTRNGAYLFDLQSKKSLRFINDPSFANNEEISCIYEDHRGRLWIGTRMDGIFIVDLATRKLIRHINQNAGLSNNSVASILASPHDNYWISTANGLSHIWGNDFNINNYYVSDGLTNNEFNRFSCFQARNGKLYFGTIDGISSFDPSEVIQPSAPRIFLSQAEKWSNPQNKYISLWHQALMGQAIELSPNDRSLTFHFGISDFLDIDKNRFEYRIMETSHAWKEMDNINTLRFESLPYGTLHLEIRAFNASHSLTANTLNYVIHVKRPFYLTWWYYVLVFLFFAAIAALILYLRIQNLKNLSQQRIQIARTLHDEVGGLITSIKIQTAQIDTHHNLPVMKDKINNIVALSDKASTSLWDTLWITDARNDKQGNIRDRFQEVADMLLTPIHIDPVFTIEIADEQVKVSPIVRQQLYLIYKEALNNIVRHAHPTYVHIHLKLGEKKYFLEIINDGAGKKNEHASGQGTSNMKYRAEVIHCRLYTECVSGVYRLRVE